jgi:hypothetical protein
MTTRDRVLQEIDYTSRPVEGRADIPRALAALRAIIEAHECEPFGQYPCIRDIDGHKDCPVEIAAHHLGIEDTWATWGEPREKGRMMARKKQYVNVAEVERDIEATCAEVNAARDNLVAAFERFEGAVSRRARLDCVREKMNPKEESWRRP